MKPYRILVTGSRDWADLDCTYANIATAVFQHVPAVIVHGACPTGADAQAAWWVRMHGQTLGVTEERHPAQGHPTEDFGPWPGAGPRRNRHMVSLGADLCLAFLGLCTSNRCRRTDFHYSHGASGCARLAAQAGITVKPIYATTKEK